MKAENLKNSARKFTKTVSSTISQALYDDVEIVAKHSEVDVSKIIRSLLEEFVEENKFFISKHKSKKEDGFENDHLNSGLPVGTMKA